MLLVNITGAPGVGKTVAGAGLFYALASSGYRAALASDYVGEMLAADGRQALEDEPKVFAQKYRRLLRLEDFDIVLTDSPLINSLIHGREGPEPVAPDFYRKVAGRFDSIFILLGSIDEADPMAPAACLAEEVRITQRPCLQVDDALGRLPEALAFIQAQAAARGISPRSADASDSPAPIDFLLAASRPI